MKKVIVKLSKIEGRDYFDYFNDHHKAVDHSIEMGGMRAKWGVHFKMGGGGGEGEHPLHTRKKWFFHYAPKS